MKNEQIEQKVTQELGYVSALFMTQECKGTEIVMPTKELKEASDRISLYVFSLIHQARAEERERVVGLATKDRNKYARKVAIVGVPHLYDYYKGKISSLDDLIEAVKE